MAEVTNKCKMEYPKFSEPTRTTLSSYRHMESEDAHAAGAVLSLALCEIGHALKSLVSGNHAPLKHRYPILDHGKI